MASFDFEAFWAGLWDAGATSTCASCGVSDWSPASLTKSPNLDPVTGEIDHDNGVPAVRLFCLNCGFIRFHVAPSEQEEGGNGASGR
jgi:hypothetical protein